MGFDCPTRLLATLSLLSLAACASARPVPGTGDVAFRLTWSGSSDLDLMVEDPTGECLFYGFPSVASGGLLDVDCNGFQDRLCARPIENAYWPPGSAPAGRYRIWIHAHVLYPEETPLRFELRVLRGHRVATKWRDEFRVHQELVGPFGYDFPAGTPYPAARRDVAPAPACSGPITRMRPVP